MDICLGGGSNVVLRGGRGGRDPVVWRLEGGEEESSDSERLDGLCAMGKNGGGGGGGLVGLNGLREGSERNDDAFLADTAPDVLSDVGRFDASARVNGFELGLVEDIRRGGRLGALVDVLVSERTVSWT